MSEDKFTKLFKYMQAKFKLINDRLEQTVTKDGLDRLTNTMNVYAK